ncbi:hypothetical protein JCM9279_001722 [Rhodotorula babjevae]
MVPDPLSADALVALAPQLVSPSCTLASPIQALALVVHTVHTALGFRLTQPRPLDGDGHPANRLPDEWPPHSSAGELKFRYRHDQSSLEFVVTVVELGDRALVAGAAVDNPARSSTFDLVLNDYFSPTSLSPSTAPLPVAALSPSNPFATRARFNDLVHLYRLNVLQRLVPGLSKDGYDELRAPPPGASGSGSGGSGGAARGPGYYPDRGGPMGMFPPSRGGGGEGEGGRRSPPAPPRTGGPAYPAPNPDRDRDPLAIPGSGGRGGGGYGGLPRADIGRRDLEPLGGMGGTFGGLPGMGGGGGFGGLGGLGGGGGMGGMGGGGGGMLMGSDHPLFRERFGPSNDVVGGGEGRRWGGDGYLPPMGAPQGARFDPVGPTNGPPTGGLGGPNAGGGPQRPGQPPQGQMGGLGGSGGGARRAHPDMEQPGANNEWQNSMFG